MKLIFCIFLSVPAWTFAHECNEVVYTAQDYAVVEDHEGDMSKTCLAAEKAALWKACVDCAGNMESGDDCHAGVVQSAANKEAKICEGFAEAKTSPCKTKRPIVHCADLVQR